MMTLSLPGSSTYSGTESEQHELPSNKIMRKESKFKIFNICDDSEFSQNILEMSQIRQKCPIFYLPIFNLTKFYFVNHIFKNLICKLNHDHLTSF